MHFWLFSGIVLLVMGILVVQVAFITKNLMGLTWKEFLHQMNESLVALMRSMIK